MTKVGADRVYLTQLVHQHAYQLAAHLASVDCLDEFATGIFFALDGDSRSNLLPSRVRSRRSYPGIPAERVRCHLIPALVQLVGAAPAKPIRFLEDCAFELFDRAAGQRLLRSNASIVHGFEGQALSTFTKARDDQTRVLDVPAVAELDLWFRGSWRQRRRARRVLAERALADLILVGSSRVRHHVLRYTPSAHVVEAPYGVDSDSFARAQPSLGHSGLMRVLFVGHAWRRKGLRDLVEACSHPELIRRTELTVVGVAASDIDFAVAEQLSVNWLGNVPKNSVADLYKANDVFVLPSTNEGSALSVLEAMAARLLVVTTEAAGSPVVDGASGFIVPPGRTDEIVARLKLVLDRPEAARAMARAAGDEASRRTWEAYGTAVVDAYAASRRPRSGPGF